MAELREVLTRNGIAQAIEMTAETADDISKIVGGVVLFADDPDDLSNATVTGVRIPTLHGNVDAEIGDFVIRASDNGRVEVLSKEQYHNRYFERFTNPDIVAEIKNQPPVEAEPVQFESEEDLQAHTSRNLFEERQRKLYGRSADQD